MKRSLLFSFLIAMTLLLTACPGGNGPSTPTFNLDVSVSGSGTVTSIPDGITCGEDCEETYEEDTVVELTATAADGFTFEGFSENCTVEIGTPNICEVTMDEAKTVQVTFEEDIVDPVQYELTVTPAGTGSGTVTSDPAGIDCGDDCTEAFTEETSVTLTATSDEGSEFGGFTGCTPVENTDTCTLTVGEAGADVTATFNPVEAPTDVTLTVEAFGNGSSGGVVRVNGTQYIAPRTFDTGETVTLEAIVRSAFAAEVDFVGWAGACSGVAANQNCALTLTEDTTVRALFSDGTETTTTGVIAMSTDDAEEALAEGSGTFAGDINTDSGDLDLNYDRTNGVGVISGLRFTGISIPEGATVTYAHIQFRAQTPTTVDAEAAPLSVVVSGEKLASAPTFDEALPFDITNRTETDTSVTWTPDPWGNDPSPDPKERTPDVSSIVQEIASLEDWDGETMVFFVAPPQVDGSYQVNELNTRSADAYDDNPSGAAELVIYYEGGAD